MILSYWDTLALVYYQKGMYTEAENAIKKALELKPDGEAYLRHLNEIKEAKSKW